MISFQQPVHGICLETKVIISAGSQVNGTLSSCCTNLIWFSKWIAGCEIRIGFIFKQNKDPSIHVLLVLFEQFKRDVHIA